MFDHIEKFSEHEYSSYHKYDKYDKHYEQEKSKHKDNIFLPIFKFLNYNSESTEPILNSKEIIKKTIGIIENYCTIDIKNKCKKYIEELFCNEQSIDQMCSLVDLKKSFYDSRNYSINVMFNILLGTYDNYKQPPILVYILNDDGIFDGHIFIQNHYTEGCLEAISIQSSLKILVDSKCNNKKYGISTKLFDYVFCNIITMFKNSVYIYAYAWKIMSDILVKKYNFNTFTFIKHGDNYFYYVNNKNVITNNVTNENINVNSIEYGIIRDLKHKASLINGVYVFTVKKI
jgi:hypothetical protein